MSGSPDGVERKWLRALGLLTMTFLLSVVQPLVLVAVPLAALALSASERRTAAFVVAVLAGAFALGGASRLGLWYMERGWALLVTGWFLALSLRWPQVRFFSRGLGAVAGAFAGAALIFTFRPESWSVVDWTVTSRLSEGAGSALEALRLLRGEALSPALVGAIYETAEIQGMVFPALLGLSSVAGLGVAWWLYHRFVYGSDEALGALKDFRFNDQLIWVLITGCFLLLVAGGEGWRRTGTNAVVFMGGFYALRGAAVVLFVSGGISFFGAVLVGLGLILLPPVFLAGALVIGVSDTWLDIRSRAQGAAG